MTRRMFGFVTMRTLQTFRKFIYDETDMMVSDNPLEGTVGREAVSNVYVTYVDRGRSSWI